MSGSGHLCGRSGAADDKVQINWDLCTNCGKCVPVCPTKALYLFGQEMTVDQVLDEVEQDSTFYRESGGGITLSGGECLLQPDFMRGAPGRSAPARHQHGDRDRGQRAVGFHGEGPAARRPVLHDHKLTDPERHKKWSGVDNTRIRENFKRAYETFPDTKFIARTPLIPGVNDDEEHIRAILAFIQPYKNVIDYELLPYHRFGESKYGFLGKVYEMEDFASPTPKPCGGCRRSSTRRLAATLESIIENDPVHEFSWGSFRPDSSLRRNSKEGK